MDNSSTSLIPSTVPLFEIASNSESRLVHFSHTLTVNNFSHRFDLSSKTYLDSSEFSFAPEEKQTFRLKMYPNGKTEESKGYLSLFLQNTRDSSSLVVGCKFAILDDKGNKCNVQEILKKLSYYYCGYVKNDDEREMGFEKYISRKELFVPSNGFLTSNKLTIYVEIFYVIEQRGNYVSYKQISIEYGEKDALEDYANLLKTGKLSDVLLIVSGTEFRAHKLILSARSPVFCAMFEHDLMEKQQNRVEITDVKPEVFQQLLSYIYSGKIDSIEQNVEDLLAAADKYQLIALKSICEKFLFTKVSVESAPNLLVLADLYNAGKLKTNVLDFMKRQSYETFQTIVKANPELLVDMFRYLANKSEQLEK